MSKDEWNYILEVEQGQEIALAVVEQVLERVSNVIFKKRIQNQLIPYTLDHVKSVAMEVINWRFLKKDNGFMDRETLEMDVELESIQPDSWARGILKVYKEIPKIIQKENVPVIPNKNWKVSTAELSIPQPKTQKFNKIYNPIGVKRQNKEKEASEPVKKLSADQIIILENKKILDRIKHLEKDGNLANYTFDSDGRIILVRKSAPVKAFNPHVTATLVEEKPVKSTTTFRKERTKKVQKTSVSVLDINQNSGFIPDESLNTTNLIDVKVAPGVVFKEGNVVKDGGEFILPKQEIQPQPPSKVTKGIQNNQILSKILEKARPFVKSLE